MTDTPEPNGVKPDDGNDGRQNNSDKAMSQPQAEPSQKPDDGHKPPKKKKVKYVDDGHTVYSMDGLDEIRGTKRRGDGIKLSRAEKWAAIKAAFARYTPILLMVIGCFSLTAVLLYFWLK